MFISLTHAYSIKTDLLEFLDENISGKYNIRYLSPETKFQFPDVKSRMKITFEFSESSDLRGNELIFVNLTQGEEIIHSEEISVFLKIYREIIATTHNIAKGQTISNSDLKYVNQDVTTKTNYFTDAKNIVGKIALRRINSGKIIKSTFIRAAFDVQVGDEISIVSRCGNVIATTSGIAHQNGYIGNTITVYNPSFRKTLKVKISSDKKGLIE